MAWTTTKTAQFNAGDQVIQLWNLTADSATLELNTGLGYVNHAAMAPASMNSANSKYVINALKTSTSAAGYVSITGCTSGNHIFLTVYGR